MTFLRLPILLLLSLASQVAGAETKNLLGTNWELLRPSAEAASMRATESNTIELTVHAAADPFWKIMIAQVIPDDLPANHLLKLSFRARSSTKNSIRTVIEQTASPYLAAAQTMPTLAVDWQNYELNGVSPGFGKGGLAIKFQIGQQAGIIELADIHLVDLGIDPAVARAVEAITPAEIAKRIDRYRKRSLQVHVTDATGRPASNVRIELTQVRHAFLFGCNLFGLDTHSTDPLKTKYRDRFAEIFNYATLPFYWGSYEPTPGQKHEGQLREMAEWAKEHGITCKGHPLVYQIVYPDWAPKDAASVIPLLHARETDIIRKFDGLIDIWDVINEANTARDFPNTGVGAWIIRDGPPAVVASVLQWAREANPHHGETFLYNDYETGPDNLTLLNALKNRNALPDAIGMQAHMHSDNWKLEKIWTTAENLAQFGKPIHFTETTIPSGDHRPVPNAPGPDATDWFSTPAGEKDQADYIVKYYSILFSHPSLRAITWWDFSDKNAWLGAPAGLLRADMSPKPAFDALMKLIHHDWWTTASLTTDSSGRCDVRAFCGDYDVTIAGSDKHFDRIQLPTTDIGAADSPVSIELKM